MARLSVVDHGGWRVRCLRAPDSSVKLKVQSEGLERQLVRGQHLREWVFRRFLYALDIKYSSSITCICNIFNICLFKVLFFPIVSSRLSLAFVTGPVSATGILVRDHWSRQASGLGAFEALRRKYTRPHETDLAYIGERSATDFSSK